MTDLALFWNDETFSADVSVKDGDLATDTGLRSAILVSLFTDRRARPDDKLPYEGAERRGWWGDVADEEADDLIGSRLWLLEREKQTSQVVARAREYALEALAWLLRDGVAAALDVTAEVVAPGVLGLAVFVTRPGGPARQRFDFVWRGLTPS